MNVFIAHHESAPVMISWNEFRHPSLTSPLHLAICVRAGLYDDTSVTQDEIGNEFVKRGWCTREEFDAASDDLENAGLLRPSNLVPNPNLHTGEDCPRCAEHEDEFRKAWQRYEQARARWEEGPHTYPYAPAARTLHRTSCTHGIAARGPRPPADTLRQFAHRFLDDRRFVPKNYALHEGLHTYWPGEQLSVREARAWVLQRTGPQGGRYWNPCKLCKPVDPFLLDLPNEDVTYGVPNTPGMNIPVTVNGTVLRRLFPAMGLSRKLGRTGADGAESAYVILLDALGGAHAMRCRKCTRDTRSECECVRGRQWLPYEDLRAEVMGATPADEAPISRSQIRQWLDHWYARHPERERPAVLAQVLDRDLASRGDLTPELLL